MSIFSNIIDAGKKFIGGGGGTVLGGLLGGPAGAVAGSVLGSTVGKAAQALPTLKKVLPGVGQVAAGAAGGYLGGKLAGYGGMHRRRRGRGFSARDIRQTRRMLALMRDVERSCPTRRRAAPARRVCR